MSATLGDVTFFRDDLTRRTGRPTALVTSVERPVPLHYRYVLSPLHETITELLQTHEAPVYVVHFTQASAVERAQALMSVNVTSREEKQAIADLIGNFRFTAGLRARRCRGWCATGSACTTPGCSPATAGSWRPSPRPACSRSSAAPTPWASASTCRSARCCSRR